MGRLKLGLGCLERSHHDITDVAGRFVEVEAHALRAEALADHVPLDAIFVDHVRKTR